MEFSNKTAIITGAASGMGLLSAQRLADQGARVVLTDVNLDAAEAAADSIRKSGGQATAMAVDVRDYVQVKAAAQQALEIYGSIDILINCAGGASTRIFGCTEGFKDIDIGIIDWGIDVNLKGPIYFSHAVIGTMMEQKKRRNHTPGLHRGGDRLELYRLWHRQKRPHERAHQVSGPLRSAPRRAGMLRIARARPHQTRHGQYENCPGTSGPARRNRGSHCLFMLRQSRIHHRSQLSHRRGTKLYRMMVPVPSLIVLLRKSVLIK